MSPNTAHPASPLQQDAQDYTTYQDCLEVLKQTTLSRGIYWASGWLLLALVILARGVLCDTDGVNLTSFLNEGSIALVLHGVAIAQLIRTYLRITELELLPKEQLCQQC
ncbi:hypothetical protein QCD60_29590 [Pokkaliibacter sp. MBI-7]|uniref:hypothetical protein n=1 Tax=Pokkaliibacter sp. MBI-7 TaxID=3040600 RepID=UPI00244B7B71|nr:hypothetical protein [Pokkaliibacter sp. MBI-7]MDH2436671.1 hypothetical protein [Pokkaliibacter sp. MBI-7]